MKKVRNLKVRLGVLAACSMAFSVSMQATINSQFQAELDDDYIESQLSQATNNDPFSGEATFNIPQGMNAKFASNGIIVKYKPGKSALSVSALSSRARTNMKFKRNMFNGSKVYNLDRFYPNVELESMVATLNQDPNIEYAEVDARMFPVLTPNDTNFNLQWHYQNTSAGINLPSAWDISTGSGVNVAVLDTGYRPHADLNANIVGGYDFISNSTTANDGGGRDSNAQDPGDWTTGQCGQPSNSSWHGTHVAGTIAAVTNNGSGVAGVAYGAKVVPVRVLGTCGGSTSDIADGIRWSSGASVSGVPANANPAKVINMSLGGGSSCNNTTQSAINVARANGSVIVVAAGNSNANVSGFTPASCNGVVAVAATNKQSNRSTFSNFGNLIDIAAPGGQGGSEGVLSTVDTGTTTPAGDGYNYYAGTSMAAPHVAGVAALMLSVDPTLTPDEIEATLKSSAKPFASGSNCNTSICGDGALDALAAVQAVGSTPPPPPPPPPPAGDGSLTNGVAETGLSGSTGNQQFFTLEVPAGATGLSFVMNGGSGDADLYVRFGSAPTTSSYDCRPFRNGNAETCSISNVQAGTYHVMVRAYSNFSGVSLTGSYTAAPPPPPPSAGGSATVNDISASRRAWKRYTLNVPAGMSSLVASISGGSGDADLYVRRGAQASTSQYDCRPYRTGNNETCTINNPAADTWHIDIRAYSAFSGVTLQVDWE